MDAQLVKILLLWYTKVNYSVHKTLLLDPLLSQFNPVHTNHILFL